jgi:hypothetical protein
MKRQSFSPFRPAMLLALAAAAVPFATAKAGPPYQSDDPEPTDYKHFEIYAFADGAVAVGDVAGESGIDFNYGALRDLQLTAVLPLGYDSPAAGDGTVSFGRVELAAKYRVFHQDDLGIDVAFFPRVFLPAGSPAVGARNTSLLLPIWIEKDWGAWSVFGGGACELNRGDGGANFCLTGWTLTRQVLPDLQLGAEIFHQTSDTIGGRATTSVGAGIKYDLSENYHLLGYLAPTIQNARETSRYQWYASVLFTF